MKPDPNPQSAHTATPWRIGRYGAVMVCKWIDADHDENIAQMAEKNAEGNAAFIVRACNAHDALYEACKRSLAVLTGQPSLKDIQDCRDEVKAALALAKKGEV